LFAHRGGRRQRPAFPQSNGTDAPAGTKAWGPDQCANDDEGEVDHNEKLTLVGVKSGRYDMKIADKNGRVCVVKNVDVKEGNQFSIKEQDLTDCGK
jgi:hypothetical protein